MPRLLLQRMSAETLGEGALFLIVGGLFMLGLVVALVVLRSIFPQGKPSRGLEVDRLERAILPTPAVRPATEATRAQALARERVEEGRRAAEQLQPKTIDVAFDHMVQKGWGQPRLLRHLDDRTLVRLHGCAECAGTGGDVGCGFHAGFLEGVLRHLEGAQAQVAEVACHRRGAPACEFEVRH